MVCNGPGQKIIEDFIQIIPFGYQLGIHIGRSFRNFVVIGVVVGLAALIQNGYATAQTVGPNRNLSKASGNQYETSVAINPNDNNQLFVVSRNEIGGLSTARSSDGGLNWTSQLIARSTLPQPGDVPRAYGNATVAWDSFGNLFLAYLSQGGVNTATYVTLAVSTDGGVSFHSPTGAGPSIFLPNNNSPLIGDQPTVTVGPGSGGFPASVWVTYWTMGGIAVSGAGVSGIGVVGSFSSQTVPQPPG